MTSTVRFIGSGDSFGSGGRFQTCILVDAGGTRFAMDFGTSSMISLRQQDIDPNSIDTIVLSHLHGDHCAGVPFLLMDAMLASKRERPLTVAGPRDLRYRMFIIQEALFPGMHVMKPRFELNWVELEPGEPTAVGNLRVTARSVRHTWQTNPTALRVEVGGKVVSYTGDGEFGEQMALAAKGADLLVAECYFYSKPVPWHLNYPDVVAHKDAFQAKRIILTHMSREMLDWADKVPEECAYDGLVVEIWQPQGIARARRKAVFSEPDMLHIAVRHARP